MFEWRTFVSHSGKALDWKIECDALTAADWDCLARLVASRLVFGQVVGIPRGGLPFAKALAPFVTPGSETVLIVDDVMTTGQSMENERAKYLDRPVQGVVLFNRIQWRNQAWLDLRTWILPVFNIERSFVD